MQKKIIVTITIAFMIMFTACGKHEGNINKASETSEMFNDIYNGKFQDNSLDKYSAAFIKDLNYTECEDAIEGGAEQYIVGNESASVLKKHLFTTVTNCWDEIKCIKDGDEYSNKLEFWTDQFNQAWSIGNIYGSDNYICMNIEASTDDVLTYRFFEVDCNMQVVKSFYVEGLDSNDYEFPRRMLIDEAGNLHMITDRLSDYTVHYYYVEKNGSIAREVNFDFSSVNNLDLFFFYNGQVGIRIDDELARINQENLGLDLITTLDKAFYYAVISGENSIMYADYEGLHSCSLSGENEEIIYTWSNHGLMVSDVLDMMLSNDNSIGILSVSQSGVKYVKLLPTVEEVPMVEIEFAVNSNDASEFQSKVADFNEKHPTCFVRLKEYSTNDTTFYTKLIAGEGPQLVETSLVGFSENEDLWQPLDEFYSSLELENKIIPQVFEGIKINDIPYGVSTDFLLDTVITFKDYPNNWDYKTFIDCIKNDNEATKSVYLPTNGSDGYTFIAYFFYHGMDETFLYDAGTCKTYFSGDEFRDILKIGDGYMSPKTWPNVEDVKKGKSPCAKISLFKPEDIACLRIYGGEELRYIGVPTQTGATNYINADTTICLIKNASSEQKRVAYTFLNYLLSYDVQKDNEYFSVRKDVLEEQVNRMDEHSYTSVSGFPQFYLEDKVDNTKDAESLNYLLENSKPRKRPAPELTSIFVEEIYAYLSGEIKEEDLINHLDSRVTLLLNENK